MKIQKLMYSPQAKNLLASSSKTEPLTSRSQSITCSVQGDYQSFQTPNGSKYCRGRQLTLMSSSPESAPLSLTTEQQRHLKSSNSILDIWNQPKLSGTTGTGLLHIVCSNMQCISSTPIESQNSFGMVNTWVLTSCLLIQEAKSTSSTLIKWSTAGLDLSTMYHLTNLRYLDFLRSNTSSVKWQETKVHQGISKEHWLDSEEEGWHGEARIYVSCSTKEDAWSRHLTAVTDTFALGVGKKDMLKWNAQARRLEQYWARGKRPKCAREYLWEVDEEE